MHDCHEVEEKLIDLVFDELGVDERSRLVSEIGDCSVCLAEYSSIRGTMRIFDEAVATTMPDESYWPQHHQALTLHLETNAPHTSARNEPLWKRFFAIRLRVPVPVAAAFVILLLALSALALRRSTTSTQIVLEQPSSVPQLTTKIVEVPVVREKVITRTVYFEKRREKGGDLRQTTGELRDEALMMAQSAAEDGRKGLFTRASLTDFQPPDEMRIRIIKRNKSYEK